MNHQGVIITFYSYKGGTGRTMALANTACLLSEKLQNSGKRVLMIDFDLEAPGLHNFFSDISKKIKDEQPGIINYFDSLQKIFSEDNELYRDTVEQGWQILDKNVSFEDYIISDVLPNLDFIQAGKFNENYSDLVNSFDWFGFYNNFGEAIRIFKESVCSNYHYILVDSRTGLTDISGICTMLLPEKLVGVFTPNRQSLDGLLKLIRQAVEYRRASNDFRPLAVFPLPSRIDIDEPIRREKWLEQYQNDFQKLFQEIYEIQQIELTEYFNDVQLPHTKYYAYGEEIAVMTEKRRESLSLSRAYQFFFDRLINLDSSWEKLSKEKETTQQELSIKVNKTSYKEERNNRKNKVFISYAPEDYSIAKKLYDSLNQAGIASWLDTEDILPGQKWRASIKKAIINCSHFLILISKNSVSKIGYIQKEQKISLDLIEDLPNNAIFIIPARLDNTEPLHEVLKTLHWADFTTSYEKGLEQIINVFKSEAKKYAEIKIDFMGREDELKLITSFYSPPYIMLVAPMGYGKTRLLEELKRILEEQKWLCVTINLSRWKHKTLKDLISSFSQIFKNEIFSNVKTFEEAGSEIAQYIDRIARQNKQKGIFIQIDEAENIHTELAIELFNHFIPAFEETINYSQSPLERKFVVSGREIISSWKNMLEIPFHVIVLKTFDFNHIYQTVEHVDSSSELDRAFDYKMNFSAWLMNFTGGHPKCIAETINNDYGLPMSIITKRENENYVKIVKPVIQDIKKFIPEELVEIFYTLSVVRKFNFRLLKKFVDCELIQWDKSVFDLEYILMETYLIDKINGFLRQDITRRLLANDLRRNNIERFIHISKLSISFYETALKDYEIFRSDIIAVELLFQEMQIIYNKEGNKEDVFKNLNNILKILTSYSSGCEIIYGFKQLLTEDWEFRFTLNYLFRKKNYDESYPFNQVINIIDDFSRNLKY